MYGATLGIDWLADDVVCGVLVAAVVPESPLLPLHAVAASRSTTDAVPANRRCIGRTQALSHSRTGLFADSAKPGRGRW
ncbi:hypothetical protein Acsp01_39410 [Actinoplanes sp. NBRC 101535]|nr:hypothetical protein Acsp01_39410 [Actinoplanes sp. NBRC 101535]